MPYEEGVNPQEKKDPYLTRYSKSECMNQEDFHIKEQCAKKMPVDDFSQSILTTGSATARSETGGEITPRTGTEELVLSFDNERYKCKSRGFKIALTDELKDKYKNTLNLQKHATLITGQQTRLEDECATADLLTNPSNYLPDHNESLAIADRFNNPTAKPKVIIGDMAATIRRKSGVPKKMLSMKLGAEVYEAFTNREDIQKRYKNDTIDEKILADYFGVKEVVVGLTSTEDVRAPLPGTFVDLWGKILILHYVDPNPSLLSSTMLGHIMRGEWKKRAWVVTRWYDEDTDCEWVKTRQAIAHAITNKKTGALITNCI